MPILNPEDDIWPADLLDQVARLREEERTWWCVYTLSRREKDLMRKLRSREIPFYGPIIPRRYRSPNGRMRTSFIPLFPNYVFLLANEDERAIAFQTNCISKCTPITDEERLVRDLSQIHRVIQEGIPLTPEAKLIAGDHVRVRRGPFAGYEGSVIRREGKTRLLLSIQFLEKGVSMAMDEGLLEVV